MSTEADQVIGLYRRSAQAWAALRGSELREQKWIDRFFQALPDRPSVLDLGCGSGDPIGRYLLSRGCELTGVDASPQLIDIAKKNVKGGHWIVSDMRNLQLDSKFDGILAWNSTFHLTPDDQRQMFHVFERHAEPGSVLIFTSGPHHGESIGEFEGEALYHSSLEHDEYRALLDRHSYEVMDHVVEDPECGLSTIWVARFRAKRQT